MPPDSPRILELRRRVQSDPASIAFAQLAEEYRRAGSYDEAITCCRTGLARHPGYLSARVTLGRALSELGSLDEAAREFELVLRSAADNLAAIRGMAEIHQRRGELAQALTYYKRALDLARHDPELEETVTQIGRELGQVGKSTTSTGLSFAQAQTELQSAVERMPRPIAANSLAARSVQPTASPTVSPAAPVKPTTPTTDFDAVLRNLGAPDATPPPATEQLISEAAAAKAPRPILEVLQTASASDPFADLEAQLRDFDTKLARTTDAAGALRPAAPKAPARDLEVLDELESWLSTLQAERGQLHDRE